jgi:hypothetical protein
MTNEALPRPSVRVAYGPAELTCFCQARKRQGSSGAIAAIEFALS